MRPSQILLVASVVLSPQAQAAPQAPEHARAALSVLEDEGHGAETTGGAMALIRQGELEFLGACGTEELGQDRALGPDSLMASGLVARQVVTALILTLAREERIDLDQDLATILPAFAHLDPQPTLRHVLEHKSGLRSVRAVLRARGLGEERSLSREEALGWAAKQRRPLGPNTRRGYPAFTNTNSLILAEVLVQVAEEDLDALASRRLFRPLEMKSARFEGTAEELPSDRCVGYSYRKKEWHPGETIGQAVGHSGLWLSVMDLARWGSELLNPRVLHPQVAKALRTSEYFAAGEMRPLNRVGYEYEWRGLPVIRMSRGEFGYRSELMLYPKQGWVFAGLSNSEHVGLQEAAEATLEVLLAPELSAAPPFNSVIGIGGGAGKRSGRRTLKDFDLASVVGSYHMPELDLELELMQDKRGRLRCSIAGRPEVTVRAKTASKSRAALVLGINSEDEITLKRDGEGTWRVTTLDWTFASGSVENGDSNRLPDLVLLRR